MTNEPRASRFANGFVPVPHSEDSIEIRKGAWSSIAYALKDPSSSGILAKIVEALDNGLEDDEIAEKLGVDQRIVNGVVNQLEKTGAIAQGPQSTVEWFSSLTGVPRSGTLQEVAIPTYVCADFALGEILSKKINTLSPSSRVSPIARGAKRYAYPGDDIAQDGLSAERALDVFAEFTGGRVVWITEQFDPIEALWWNRACIRHSFSILYAFVDGPYVIVGPYVEPMRTGCFECLEVRAMMNLRNSASYVHLKRKLISSSRSTSTEPKTENVSLLGDLLTAFVILQLASLASSSHCLVENRVLTVFLPTMEFGYQTFLRNPTCSACGSQSGRDDVDLYFDIRSFLTERGDHAERSSNE